MQNDVSVLISAAQNSGMQALLSQLFSDIQSVAIGLSEPSGLLPPVVYHPQVVCACMRK